MDIFPTLYMSISKGSENHANNILKREEVSISLKLLQLLKKMF